MTKSILLVDDDEDDSELFFEALQEIDPSISFLRLSDGCEVIGFLEQETVHPDLIFLDINMPRMDGWECLVALKSKAALHEIPVYMYSTSSLERDHLRAIELGAAKLINKPNNFGDLKKVISEAIAEVF